MDIFLSQRAQGMGAKQRAHRGVIEALLSVYSQYFCFSLHFLRDKMYSVLMHPRLNTRYTSDTSQRLRHTSQVSR